MAVYGGPGGGRDLQRIGTIFCYDLPPVKARILLMLALADTGNPEKIKEWFQVGVVPGEAFTLAPAPCPGLNSLPDSEYCSIV